MPHPSRPPASTTCGCSKTPTKPRSATRSTTPPSPTTSVPPTQAATRTRPTTDPSTHEPPAHHHHHHRRRRCGRASGPAAHPRGRAAGPRRRGRPADHPPVLADPARVHHTVRPPRHRGRPPGRCLDRLAGRHRRIGARRAALLGLRGHHAAHRRVTGHRPAAVPAPRPRRPGPHQHHHGDHRHHRRQRNPTLERPHHAGQDPILLRFHHHALRPRPRPRDAVPLPRSLPGRRPDRKSVV